MKLHSNIDALTATPSSVRSGRRSAQKQIPAKSASAMLGAASSADAELSLLSLMTILDAGQMSRHQREQLTRISMSKLNRERRAARGPDMRRLVVVHNLLDMVHLAPEPEAVSADAALGVPLGAASASMDAVQVSDEVRRRKLAQVRHRRFVSLSETPSEVRNAVRRSSLPPAVVAPTAAALVDEQPKTGSLRLSEKTVPLQSITSAKPATAHDEDELDQMPLCLSAALTAPTLQHPLMQKRRVSLSTIPAKPLVDLKSCATLALPVAPEPVLHSTGLHSSFMRLVRFQRR